ncbi:hypothetical protein JCM10213_002556 [Rhodosporidiobolus nylandii]
MAKSATSKGKMPAKARAPSPAPSSSSASPSSSSSRGDESSDSDSSSSSSGRSSASPEPVAQPQRRVDPSTQKYTAPEGFKAVRVTKAHEQLDWDALNDDQDLELWAVRVPAGVKPKHLDGLTLTLPDAANTASRKAVGHFTAKKADYDVFLTGGEASNKRKRDGEAAEVDDLPGAKELQSLVPLVPRKTRENKLFQAPRPIARTLLINRALPPSVLASTSALQTFNNGHSTLIASQPSPVPGAILSAEELLDTSKGAAKKAEVLGTKGRAQPSELLKFRLDLAGNKGEGGQGHYHNPPPPRAEQPFVSAAAVAEGEAAGEDVEMGEAQPEEAELEVKKEKKSKKDKEAKKERRKSKGGDAGAEDTPKKKRKVKEEA